MHYSRISFSVRWMEKLQYLSLRMRNDLLLLKFFIITIPYQSLHSLDLNNRYNFWIYSVSNTTGALPCLPNPIHSYFTHIHLETSTTSILWSSVTKTKKQKQTPQLNIEDILTSTYLNSLDPFENNWQLQQPVHSRETLWGHYNECLKSYHDNRDRN